MTFAPIRGRRTSSSLPALLTPLLMLAGSAAHATDGYFANGYGMKAIGMGGAAAAVAQEPFGGAVNPGAMSFLDTQWQAGLSWFSPDRDASRKGSGLAGIDGSVTSDSKNFFVPEFGWNWRTRPDLAVGVTVYGNGGMNTDYPGGQIAQQSACANFNPSPGPYNLLCGNGRLGVDLTQLMIAPYVSWQFMPGQSIGIAPTLAYQRFKANGLQAFDNPMLSTAPGKVTNNGSSSSWGGGVRIGWMGQFSEQFALGAAYATKMWMGEFDDYRGLFAKSGDFDIPSNFTLGGAFRPTREWLLALDFQRIFYGDTKAVSNPSSLMGNCAMGDAGACLGGSNGAGFGWRDINVWKFGVQYELNDQWALRGGFNYTQNPVRPQDVTFNILAPGIVQKQWTLGATWKIDRTSEITGMAMFAQRNSVTGTSLLVGFGAPPTTTETISMKETQIGIAYTLRY
ncbi:MAG TPA: outer membrane protein transport protein [Rubrivivax sp.]|nr:outer membrane protein transport protein [Rubrivivax sp.]